MHSNIQHGTSNQSSQQRQHGTSNQQQPSQNAQQNSYPQNVQNVQKNPYPQNVQNAQQNPYPQNVQNIQQTQDHEKWKLPERWQLPQLWQTGPEDWYPKNPSNQQSEMSPGQNQQQTQPWINDGVWNQESSMEDSRSYETYKQYENEPIYESKPPTLEEMLYDQYGDAAFGCDPEEISKDYNLTQIVLDIKHITKTLKEYKWSLSEKIRGKHGRKYYYKEVTENGKRKTIYVKKQDEESVLQQWNQKKELKVKLKAAEIKLAEMSKKARRQARALIRHAPDIVEMKIDALCTADGQKADSKNEQEIELLLKHFGLEYEMHVEFDPWNPKSYIFDFKIKKDDRWYYWEHLGMLDDPGYVGKQNWKMICYWYRGYRGGKNLIITTSTGKELNLTMIVWTMAYFGLITVSQAEKFCKHEINNFIAA